jgi:RND family efflux transporter MFP subunit
MNRTIVFFLGLVLWPLHATLAQAETGIQTETVRQQPIPIERNFDARIEAVHQSTVSAQTSGRITEVLFDVDDYVEKDAVLLRFSDKEQKARLNSAQASLREAQANYDLAAQELKRIQTVYAKKLVAKSALDKAEADHKAALARLNAARARVDEAAEQMQHTVVRAPYSGIVVKRHVEPGETANPGQPLMTGLSLEHLRAIVDLPQSLVEIVRKKQAQIYALLPDHSRHQIAAENTIVFPYADPATHTFRLRLQLPEGISGLYPGMLIKVAISTGLEPRITVPDQAVVFRSEVTAVYTVDDKQRIGMRQIRLGKRVNGGRLEVLAGLREGERIALDPIQAGALLKQQAR